MRPDEARAGDAARRFVIDRGSVRGEHVRLDHAWQAIRARRSYPVPVAELLGQCLAASALFAATLKMLQSDGRLTIQIQHGKPVSLVVAECRADFTVRAMARFDAAGVREDARHPGDLVSGATFALTIDPGGDYDSYQSLVPLEGDSLSAALNAYMLRSEQIESRFVLAASEEGCAGLLVQKVPEQGGQARGRSDPDLWNRVDTLTATLTSAELQGLDEERLLHRLFHQEEVRLMPPRALSFVCRCSKERVAGVLRVLGRDEVQGLLADRRTIDVDCDFCGQRFTLSADEAWAALAV